MGIYYLVNKVMRGIYSAIYVKALAYHRFGERLQGLRGAEEDIGDVPGAQRGSTG